MIGEKVGEWFEAAFLFFATPRHEPADRAPPAAPDYSKPSAWAAWPGTNGPAERVPRGEAFIPENERPADVFYVHPTIWMSASSWNGPVDDAKLNRKVDAFVITSQAAAFNKAGRIFAPRYRQCTVVATRMTERHRPVIELAYQDVKAAFRHFLEHGTDGRPLILASHSQGSFHMLRLLAEEVVGTPLMQRLVAVYAPGCWTPKRLFEPGQPLSDLPVCNGPTDTGCFIAWETFAEGGEPLKLGLNVPYWCGNAYEACTPGELDAVVVNPVSWRPDSQTPAEAHKGLVTSGYRNVFQAVRMGGLPGSTPLPPPTRRHIAVRTAKNAVYVSKVTDPELKSPPLKGKSLHMVDYNLFFNDIRENAYERAAGFKEAQVPS